MREMARRAGGWWQGALRRSTGAGVVLVVPLLAMQVSEEVHWTGSDFVFAAVLLVGAAGLVDRAMRTGAGLAWRAGMVIAIAAGLATVWTNAAVGMIGAEGNPWNGWFVGVPVTALAAAALGRFRARAMAIAMMLAAIVQGVAAAGGATSDPPGGVFSAMFVLPWLVAAACFFLSSRCRGQAKRLRERRSGNVRIEFRRHFLVARSGRPVCGRRLAIHDAPRPPTSANSSAMERANGIASIMGLADRPVRSRRVATACESMMLSLLPHSSIAGDRS